MGLFQFFLDAISAPRHSGFADRGLRRVSLIHSCGPEGSLRTSCQKSGRPCSPLPTDSV